MGSDIDDTNSAIQYSGSWGTYRSTTGGTEYGGSGHSTTSVGASATFSFNGAGIRMYCSVPHDDGTVRTINARINFDGAVKDLQHSTHPNDFTGDIWFDSGNVPNGLHTITVTFTGSTGGLPFVLDRFNIDGTASSSPPSQTTPQIPPAGGGSTPITTTKVVTTISTATNNISPKSSNTSSPVTLPARVSEGSSITTSNLSSLPTATLFSTSLAGMNGQTITVERASTAADGSISTQTSIIVNTAAKSRSDFPVGAIVGIVLSSIVLVILFILGLLFMRHRRRKNRRFSFHFSSRPTPFPAHAGQMSDQAYRHVGDLIGHATDSPSIHPSPSSTSQLFNRSSTEKSRDLLAPQHSDTSTGVPTTTAGDLPELDLSSSAMPYYLSGSTAYSRPSPSDSSTVLVATDNHDFPPSYQSLRYQRTSVNRLSSFTPAFAP